MARRNNQGDQLGITGRWADEDNRDRFYGPQGREYVYPTYVSRHTPFRQNKVAGIAGLHTEQNRYGIDKGFLHEEEPEHTGNRMESERRRAEREMPRPMHPGASGRHRSQQQDTWQRQYHPGHQPVERYHEEHQWHHREEHPMHNRANRPMRQGSENQGRPMQRPMPWPADHPGARSFWPEPEPRLMGTPEDRPYGKWNNWQPLQRPDMRRRPEENRRRPQPGDRRERW